MSESACKPGSVVDSHSSGTSVTASLKQPTRIRCGPHQWIPIWSCSEWGLPCRSLLPVARCALTAPFHPYRHSCERLGGLLSVALSVGSRLPGVTWHSALWSPDFPPPAVSQQKLRNKNRQRLSDRLSADKINGTRGQEQAIPQTISNGHYSAFCFSRAS